MKMRVLKATVTVSALALFVVSVRHAGGAAPTNGLLGYWKLDESSGSIAADSGPDGDVYPGSLLGTPLPTWSPDGMFGNCLKFDHVMEGFTSVCRVDLDAAQGALTQVISNGSNGYTLATWVKPYAVPPAGGLQCYPIIAMSLSTSVADFLGYGVDQKFVMGHTYKQTPGDEQHYLIRATDPAVSPTNIWYHIAGVVSRGSPSTVKLYVNGIPVSTNTYGDFPGSTIWTWDTALYWRLGAFSNNSLLRDPNGGSRVFIDEARIYNRALSDSEVYDCFTEGQNFAPTVAITNPANDSILTAPADILIEASATDDGAVTNVAFYEGTNWLGETDTAPYSYNWTFVAAGSYSLTAVAADNQGAMATSAVVNVFVNDAANQLPTVSITAPTEGTIYTAPADVTIEAAASDGDGTIAKVEFYAGANKLGEDATEPYAFVWTNLPGGVYSLTARAFDNEGAFSNSVAVNISVNERPTVSITSPVDGAQFPPPAMIVIRAAASDSDGTIAKVEFYAGSNRLGEVTSAPYEYAWDNVQVGNYILTAVATDDDNATGTSAAVAMKVALLTGGGPGGVGPLGTPAGVRLWCRADDTDGVQTTNASGQYVTAGNGESVLRWWDRSGLTEYSPFGYWLDGVNGATAPVVANAVANGKPMIYFEADLKRRMYGPPVSSSNSCLNVRDFTMMIVNKSLTASPATRNMMFCCGELTISGASKRSTLTMGQQMSGMKGAMTSMDKVGVGAMYRLGGPGFADLTRDNVLTMTRVTSGSQGTFRMYYNSGHNADGDDLWGPAPFEPSTSYTNYRVTVGYGYDQQRQNDTWWNGYIGEIIVYGRALSGAERIIVENHLAAKYGMTMVANDKYVGDETANGDYDSDVIGIGQTADGSNLIASAAGLTIEPSGGTMGNGEYLLAGHNAGANVLTTDRVPSGGFLLRWSRAWYLDCTGALDANLAFDRVAAEALEDPGNPSGRVLLHSPAIDSEFVVVDSEANVSGTKTSFTVTNVQDGYYTIGIRLKTGAVVVIE